jgi:hypothetical protein
MMLLGSVVRTERVCFPRNCQIDVISQSKCDLELPINNAVTGKAYEAMVDKDKHSLQSQIDYPLPQSKMDHHLPHQCHPKCNTNVSPHERHQESRQQGCIDNFCGCCFCAHGRDGSQARVSRGEYRCSNSASGFEERWDEEVYLIWVKQLSSFTECVWAFTSDR